MADSAMELVFLHGPAASGKLTTARALEELVGFPVFHNHLVVDALTTVFPFGSEPFVRLREQFWAQVFADAARVGRSLTFTFTPENTVQPGFAERVRDVVEEQDGRVYFVHLTVSDDEQERRIGAESRRALHKLTDLATLRRLRNYRDSVEQPPIDLDVDTNASSAEHTAGLIVDRFGLIPQTAPGRYPEVTEPG
jgi:chloramphenicol 3-O-phosphotransferase